MTLVSDYDGFRIPFPGWRVPVITIGEDANVGSAVTCRHESTSDVEMVSASEFYRRFVVARMPCVIQVWDTS